MLRILDGTESRWRHASQIAVAEDNSTVSEVHGVNGRKVRHRAMIEDEEEERHVEKLPEIDGLVGELDGQICAVVEVSF